MKPRFQIHQRLTRAYSEGHAHLDEWRPVCWALQTEPRRVVTDLDSRDHRFLVVLSPEQLAQAKRTIDKGGRTFRRAMEQAIEDTFSNGCSCEHDCCGHIQTSVRVRCIGPRVFSVTTHGVRNV